MAHGIERLPGNQHGHHRGLARTRCQLERQAQQIGIGRGIGRFEMCPEAAALRGGLGCHFGKPDHRFHRFHLAEERALVGKIVMAPMPQQTLGRCAHLPLRFRQGPPALHGRTDAVDHFGGIVFLPLIVGQQVGLWRAFPLIFFGLGIGETSADLRRVGSMIPVGCPPSSSRQ
jgi:hypothetical protein